MAAPIIMLLPLVSVPVVELNALCAALAVFVWAVVSVVWPVWCCKENEKKHCMATDQKERKRKERGGPGCVFVPVMFRWGARACAGKEGVDTLLVCSQCVGEGREWVEVGVCACVTKRIH